MTKGQRTSRSSIRRLAGAAMLAMMVALPTGAQEGFDYEATKAQYSTRDYVHSKLPERGYNYYKVAENAWFVHNSFENMVFFETDEGVVVVDPKPFVSVHVLEVIPQVTEKPVTHVVYSHHHRDHSQGAYLFPESATLIAHEKTAEFIASADDPKRPAPDVVWEGSYTLETGGFTLEMRDLGRNWHSQQDVIMFAPEEKILFAIDMFHPDAAPWIHWGESSDPMFAFALPGMLLDEYDFNFVIVGHERIAGTPEHMQTYKELIDDMQQIIFGIAQSDWFQAAGKERERRYDESARHFLYKDGLMAASKACGQEVIERWSGRLRNVSLNAVENCQTMFVHLIILDP